MLRLSDVKTDLAKQEAMIAEWKAENGVIDTPVVNSNKTPAFTITSNKPKAKVETKPTPKAEPLYQVRPSREIDHQKQAEYQAKFEAQKAGDLDPDYYYSFFKNKYKCSKRKKPLPSPLKYAPFTGKYGKLKGSNTGNQILWLLGQHDYIDVDALVVEQGYNRQTFLNTAKQMEKAGLLKMIKSGLKVAFMERVR